MAKYEQILSNLITLFVGVFSAKKRYLARRCHSEEVIFSLNSERREIKASEIQVFVKRKLGLKAKLA